MAPVRTLGRSAPHAAEPATRTATLIATLGALTAVAPLSIDMYIPGFPDLGRTLDTSESSVQLSMTAFLAGLVVGQLFIGPISDGLGRRRPLLAGTWLFVLLSLGCAVAPTIEVLIGARFLQGVAGAAGMVLARAIVTDRFHGPELPRYFSMLSMILGIAPVIAPVLGGAILEVTSWRVIFVVLAGFGVLLALAVLAVPESLPPERRNPDGLASTFRMMGRLVGRRAFMGYVLTGAFTSAALFTYISSSSFVFENLYEVSPTQYSLIFATNAIGMLVASAVFGSLSRRVALPVLLNISLLIVLLAVVVHVLLLATVGGSIAGTWACLFVALFGMGGVNPATMSLGQGLARDAPGAASALFGGFQFTLGAAASPLVGMLGTDSARPMAVVMLVTVCVAALARLLSRTPGGAGRGAAAAS